MTTAVYFDLDGTLCTYDEPFEAMFQRTVSPYGTPTNGAYDAYVEHLLDAVDRCEPNPYRRAFETIVTEHNFEVDATPATLAADYCDREVDATITTAGATEVLESVAATNPTGIITNGDGEQQRAKLECHGLDGRVDEVLVSNEVGVRKPDRELFATAKDRLPADDYVYVGDSYEEDIVGARDAGFQTVYVTGAGGSAVEEPAAADAVVEGVGKLRDPGSVPGSLPGVLEDVFVS
ncbi:HAD superfamily hydrolase [Natrialba magadii ATCC 43099]|uniref:HAD-superfamily hydrolase n=1 Tax=Natrialba magadii (strain ATCC 43099 / DSM 3394 / CCM 3739 / CIP 104546 / IAM 13178 / JCM 8861 / NBRC 102185 / NCIMB 2190 / MS3) TaxID=547559 RepID=D3STY2_NATMM|nr:HAD family hydrolase [Natrialba magadii]ADD07071.1 HAD superfamily hydrolase [Natrialba magadii ATCC 43099]ELY28786.1 HAD-superfamily hydrolase [Natrialba magadii ATCC 43099]